MHWGSPSPKRTKIRVGWPKKRITFLRPSSWVDTLYTFGDNITHYKTQSVHILGLMNSATQEEPEKESIIREPGSLR